MLSPSSKRTPLHRLPAFRLALLAAVATAVLALPSAALAGPHLNPVPASFKSKSLKPATLVWSSFVSRCASGSTVSGTWNSSSTGTGTMTLAGCVEGKSCTSAGQATGTVVSSSLNFELIYIDKAHTQVGLLMTPNSGAFFEPNCGGLPYKWTGSLIVRLPNVKPGGVYKETLLTLTASGSTQTPSLVEEAGAEHQLFSGTTKVGLTGEQMFELSEMAKFEP